MRKVWLAMMGAAERSYRDAGGHKNEQNPADPYMTVLGHFNSLRELGGARRILEEEVQNTIKAYGARKRIGEERGFFQDRKNFSEVVELTSRVSTDKVAEARRRLEAPLHKIEQRVDCAISRDILWSALFGGGPLRMSFRWGWSFADVSSAQPGSRRRQATRRDP